MLPHAHLPHPRAGPDGRPAARPARAAVGAKAPPVTPRPAEAALGARRVADQAFATWCRIDARLTPVIGQRGMNALYQRSLQRAGEAHACLAVMGERPTRPDDPGGLHAMLLRQSETRARDAQATLLRTFCRVLAQLIGASLARRLLVTVCPDSLSDPLTQNGPP